MADVAEYSSFLCVVLIVVSKTLQLQVTLVKFVQRHLSVIIFLGVFFFPLQDTRNYILTLGVGSRFKQCALKIGRASCRERV